MSCTHQGNIFLNGSLLFTRPNVVSIKNCRTSTLHNQVVRQPQPTTIDLKKKQLHKVWRAAHHLYWNDSCTLRFANHNIDMAEIPEDFRTDHCQCGKNHLKNQTIGWLICQRPHLIAKKNPNHSNQTIHTSAIHPGYFTNPHVTNFSQQALHSYIEVNDKIPNLPKHK